MAYLKQRLEALIGHDVRLHAERSKWDDGEIGPGQLVETGEDYVGIDIDGSMFYVLIARVRLFQHSLPREACNT
jgi:hypothetical protein